MKQKKPFSKLLPITELGALQEILVELRELNEICVAIKDLLEENQKRN